MPFPPNHCYLWNSRCKSVYFDQTNRNFSMTSLRSPIYCNLQRRYRTCRDFWDFSHFVPSYEVTNEYDMPCFFNEWDRWRPTYLLSYSAYKVTIDLSQSTHWTFLFLTVQHLKTNKKKNSEQIISCWMCQWSATGKDVARWIAILLLSLCAVHWNGCYSHRILKFPDFSQKKVNNLRSASLIC